MTESDLLAYLQQQFGLKPGDFMDTTGLFSEGLLDSFSIVDLVTYIETATGLKFDPTELNLENLDSVAKIRGFVETKRRRAASLPPPATACFIGLI